MSLVRVCCLADRREEDVEEHTRGAAIRMRRYAVVKHFKTASGAETQIDMLLTARHPGIVAAWARGTDDAGRTTLTMERAQVDAFAWVTSTSHPLLHRVIFAYWMLRDIGGGLLHWFAQGLAHGDVSSGNVLWCDPRNLRPGFRLTDPVGAGSHRYTPDFTPLRFHAHPLGGKEAQASDLWGLGALALDLAAKLLSRGICSEDADMTNASMHCTEDRACEKLYLRLNGFEHLASLAEAAMGVVDGHGTPISVARVLAFGPHAKIPQRVMPAAVPCTSMRTWKIDADIQQWIRGLGK